MVLHFPVAVLFFIISALSEAQAQSYDCMGSDTHRQFDFWLGQWQVTDADGTTVYGENEITLSERGCALREQWRSSRGGTGSSINYFNPVDGLWHQHWVDSGASIIHISGGMKGNSMVLEGRIDYLQPPRSADFRGRWTPLADGRVRQFFEERDAEGEWQTWFEGFYRQPEAATQGSQ